MTKDARVLYAERPHMDARVEIKNHKLSKANPDVRGEYLRKFQVFPGPLFDKVAKFVKKNPVAMKRPNASRAINIMIDEYFKNHPEHNYE